MNDVKVPYILTIYHLEIRQTRTSGICFPILISIFLIEVSHNHQYFSFNK
jgi:hypothetical protein